MLKVANLVFFIYILKIIWLINPLFLILQLLTDDTSRPNTCISMSAPVCSISRHTPLTIVRFRSWRLRFVERIAAIALNSNLRLYTMDPHISAAGKCQS